MKVSMRHRGFTLIELMITVAMVAIMMALATPNIIAYQRNADLTAATNSMVAAVNAAKGEAMKRGRNVMIIPADSSSWASGWAIFVDVDRSMTKTAGDIDIATGEAPPVYLDITASAGSPAADTPPYIMFDSSGYSRLKAGGFGALTLSFARNDLDGGPTPAETRRMIVASTGRVRSCKPTVATDPNYANCKSDANQ